MMDKNCVAFLQWALPKMAFKWSGFRKVHGQVCKRVRRRIVELGLEDFRAYQTYLERHTGEWARLDGYCRITISRFFRDRGVFEALAEAVLPALARAAHGEVRPLRAWCAGAASGEEPYSLTILWQLALAKAWPDTPLKVVATDSDPLMLARAEVACYPPGSLKDLPAGWVEKAFTPQNGGQDGGQDGTWCLKPEFKTAVTGLRQDLREACPAGVFDLILCRNLAFTYFDDATQKNVAARIAGALCPGGALVLGAHENLPDAPAAFAPWPGVSHVWRRTFEV